MLQGRAIRLEPLSESHHAGLCEIGLDEDLWALIPYRVATRQEMLAYIRALWRIKPPAQRLRLRLSNSPRDKSPGARAF